MRVVACPVLSGRITEIKDEQSVREEGRLYDYTKHKSEMSGLEA